jgi:hypothetical protein
MTPRKTIEPDAAHLDRVVADARRAQDERSTRSVTAQSSRSRLLHHPSEPRLPTLRVPDVRVPPHEVAAVLGPLGAPLLEEIHCRRCCAEDRVNSDPT